MSKDNHSWRLVNITKNLCLNSDQTIKKIIISKKSLIITIKGTLQATSLKETKTTKLDLYYQIGKINSLKIKDNKKSIEMRKSARMRSKDVCWWVKI